MKQPAFLFTLSALAVAVAAIGATGLASDGRQDADPPADTVHSLFPTVSGDGPGGRSRESLPPFETIIRSDRDAGRLTLFLGGDVPSGVISDFRAFIAGHEDVMDIRTLTYLGRGSNGVIMIANGPDIVDLSSVTQNLKSYLTYVNDERGETIHFDPPIRIEQGDAFVAQIVNEEPSGNAVGVFVLYATVPVAAGGDTLRVE